MADSALLSTAQNLVTAINNINQTVQQVATNTPGGNDTEIQYNNAGVFGGVTGATSNGTTVTLTSPSLVTPSLGVATATSINKITITQPATGAILTLADGSTLVTSGANSITLTSTGATNVTLPTTGTLATLAGTETLSGKTLTAPKFANGGFIADANGNELIIFTTTASAVNEVTLANGGTGVNPTFTASGETNVGLDFQAKGTGTYRLLGTSSQAAELRLYEDTDDGNNYTALKVGTQAGDITYTLPTAAPSVSGYTLTSTTAGVMSWTIRTQVVAASLSSQQDNYAISGMATAAGSVTIFRVTPTTSFKFTGIDATGVENGKRLCIENVTSTTASSARYVLLERSSASSSAANRFSYVFDAIPIILMPGDKVWFEYNTTSSRWELTSSTRHGSPNAFFTVFDDYASGGLRSSSNGTGATVGFSNNFGNEYVCGVALADTGSTNAGRAYTYGGILAPAKGAMLFLGRSGLGGNLSTVGEEYVANIGFHNASDAAAITDGAYFQYDRTATTDFRVVTTKASTSTATTVTGFTPAANTLYYFGVFINGDASNVEFLYSTDGDAWTIFATAHTTNIPNTTSNLIVAESGLTKTAGTTNRYWNIDYQGYRFDVVRGP